MREKKKRIVLFKTYSQICALNSCDRQTSFRKNNRQPSNELKFNRQPSKRLIFNRQPSKGSPLLRPSRKWTISSSALAESAAEFTPCRGLLRKLRPPKTKTYDPKTKTSLFSLFLPLCSSLRSKTVYIPERRAYKHGVHFCLILVSY